MSESLIKMIRLEDSAKDYLKQKLGWKSLTKAILKNLDFTSGSIYSMLPEELDLSNDYESSLIKRLRHASTIAINSNHLQVEAIVSHAEINLLRSVKSCIVDDKSTVFVVEDLLAKSSDPNEMENNEVAPYRYVFNDELYYLLSKSETFEKDFNIVNRRVTTMFFVGVLTRLPNSILSESRTLEIQQLEEMSIHTEKIIVGAYDGEGYIYWKKNS